jgi:hypothetical protein
MFSELGQIQPTQNVFVRCLVYTYEQPVPDVGDRRIFKISEFYSIYKHNMLTENTSQSSVSLKLGARKV